MYPNKIAFGTDVSYYQGNTINWKNYKAAGNSFTIIKASIRSRAGVNNEADYFDLHYNGATAAGVATGVYHFSRADEVEEARSEANFVLEVLAKRNITPKDLPYGVWYDVEDSTVRPIGHDRLFACLMAFKEVINAAGFGCGLYTNKDWLTNTWKYQEIVDAHIPIWMAQYNTDITFKDPSVIDIWQYSSKGKIAGIVNASGAFVDVDCNILYTPLENLFDGQDIAKIEEEPKDESNDIKYHWCKDINGKWSVYEGEQIVSDWVYDQGAWYYIAENGFMLANEWLNDDNKWYYFGKDGKMQGEGWRKINGEYYYFNSSGVMLTGWISVAGTKVAQLSGATPSTEAKTYFLHTANTGGPEGSMAVGVTVIDGNIYYFDTDGSLITNGSVTIRANSSGALK